MRRPKKAIASTRRVKQQIPQIFVQVASGWHSTYAKASIRVKAGQYQYLVWREGGRIRNLYLGRKRKA